MTYPPPYNPALTLNSRRYFTLMPIHAVGDCEPADTTNGAQTASESSAKKAAVVSATERPMSATSSAGATSGHANTTIVIHHASPGVPAAADNLSLDDRTTLVASEGACSECARENNTYLVEVINYPALQQSAKVRSQVHAKADYDAVLLVYDITSRDSFDAVTALHAEIPVCTRKNHHHHHRRAAPHASATRSRTSGWFGGGGNETGTTGSGEIVVGLVGNKSDCDDDVREAKDKEVEHGLHDDDGDDAVIFAERSLLQSLYRESILYEELMSGQLDGKKTNFWAERQLTKTLQTTQTAQTVRPSVTPFGDADSSASKNDIQKWLEMGRLGPDTMGASSSYAAEGSYSRAKAAAAIQPSSALSSVPHREVTTAEGEALAQALQLPVPFIETSAKTGAHVEFAFENLVREVLREMGRDASGTNKAGKTCRHRVGNGDPGGAAATTAVIPPKNKEKPEPAKEKERRSSLAVPVLSPTVPPSPSAHHHHIPEHHHYESQVDAPAPPATVVAEAKSGAVASVVAVVDADGGDAGAAVEKPAAVVLSSNASPDAADEHAVAVADDDADRVIAMPHTAQRRASMLGRMRKVFGRKQDVLGGDITV